MRLVSAHVPTLHERLRIRRFSCPIRFGEGPPGLAVYSTSLSPHGAAGLEESPCVLWPHVNWICFFEVNSHPSLGIAMTPAGRYISK